MTDKKEVTQTIWKAFCGELTQEPTDDMREALATTLREVVKQLQYYLYSKGEGVDGMVLNARDILEVADELENL
jgi:hypothetical protein